MHPCGWGYTGIILGRRVTRLFKRNPNVVCAELDGKATLFHASTCEYVALNETGSYIWKMLKEPSSFDVLFSELMVTYAVNSDECYRSLQEWLATALDRDLVQLVAPCADWL